LTADEAFGLSNPLLSCAEQAEERTVRSLRSMEGGSY